MFAAHHKLDNLTLFVDNNSKQLDGTTEEVLDMGDFAAKFKSFGWHMAPRSYNGHDTADILESFKWIDSNDVWPKAVIYDTVKGSGVSFMAGSHKWHGAPIDDASYEKGRPELAADFEKKEAVL